MFKIDAKEFGQYIKKIRNEKNYTLTELGDKIGYSNPYLSQIETGKKGIPSPALLRKIADALGVNPLDLFYKAKIIDEKTLNLNKDLNDPSLNAKGQEVINIINILKDNNNFAILSKNRKINNNRLLGADEKEYILKFLELTKREKKIFVSFINDFIGLENDKKPWGYAEEDYE